MRFISASVVLMGIALILAQTEVPVADTGLDAETPEIEISEDNQEDQLQNLTDDSNPEEKLETGEMMDNLQKQMDFFSDFACFLSVQRHLVTLDNEFKSLSSNPNSQTILKKMIASFFTVCKSTMTPEQQMSMITAKSKDDIDKIRIEQLDDIKIENFVNEPNPELTEAENSTLEAYEKIEEEVNKMKEKYASEQKEQKVKTESTKKAEEPRKKNVKPKKVDVNKGNSFAFVLAVMFIIIAPMYYFWTKLFGKEVAVSGKNKNKKKLKKEQDKKTQ